MDVLIVAYHGGFERDPDSGKQTERLTGENEGYQLLAEVPGIDALVTGHQHREIATMCQGVPTTQPGEKGIYIGEITLALDESKTIQSSVTNLIAVKDEPLDT